MGTILLLRHAIAICRAIRPHLLIYIRRRVRRLLRPGPGPTLTVAHSSPLANALLEISPQFPQLKLREQLLMTTSLLPKKSPLDASYRFGLVLTHTRDLIPTLLVSSAVRRFRALTRYDLGKSNFLPVRRRWAAAARSHARGNSGSSLPCFKRLADLEHGVNIQDGNLTRLLAPSEGSTARETDCLGIRCAQGPPGRLCVSVRVQHVRLWRAVQQSEQPSAAAEWIAARWPAVAARYSGQFSASVSAFCQAFLPQFHRGWACSRSRLRKDSNIMLIAWK